MEEKKLPFTGREKIRFNVPPFTGREYEYVRQAVENQKICGDGEFTKKASHWFEEKTGTAKCLMTTSCTHATELAAILADIKPGDEIIMPSYTVHYAGVACEMDTIMDIAKRHNLLVIEDAAQGVMASYKGKALGSIGDYGCYSFHETKNYSMGEGGALLIRDREHVERAEIIREKGTDRSKYFRGQVDKYRWQEFGSSYLPSELNVAYLYAQLEMADQINEARLARWNEYYKLLTPLAQAGKIELPVVPEGCVHNAHMFYIKTADEHERQELINYLKERDILAVYHYVPLHSAPAGIKYGRFNGEDVYTTKESERLLRLPMYYGLTAEETAFVADQVKEFYGR